MRQRDRETERERHGERQRERERERQRQRERETVPSLFASTVYLRKEPLSVSDERLRDKSIYRMSGR